MLPSVRARSTIIPRAIAALLTIVLAACNGTSTPTGGGDPTSPSPSTAPEEQPQVMACVTEGYPCSAGDVAADVLERSAVLADEAAELASDQNLDAALAWLEGQDGVVQADRGSHAIRFRIDGGMPTWVMERRMGDADDSAALERPAHVARNPFATVERQPLGAPRVNPMRVIGADPIVKTGLVLEPFKWGQEPDAGAEIADILSHTRGYVSNVAHLANDWKADQTVTYRTFRELAGRNVIYISSEGGQACRSDGTNCHSVIASNEVPDGTTLPNDVPGLQWMKFEGGGQAFAMSMDFFIAAYDGTGVKDAMLFLDVPNIPQDGLLDAITANSSTVFFWAGDRPATPAHEVVTSLIDKLATTGRAVGPVYHEMYDELRVDDARFDSIHPENMDGVDQRMREVVWLRDPETEESLDASGVLKVLGTLGDGKPDAIRFLVDVDGMSGDEAEHTTLNIMVDNTQAEPLLVAEGKQISTQMWQHSGSYELPWDLTPGKLVSLSAVVQLPEGGLSRQDLVLPVEDNGAPDLGTVWKGTATAVETTLWEGVTIKRTAEVEFTRDPSNPPGAKTISYYMSGGTMTFEFSGSSTECSQFPPPVEVPLIASEYSYLVFDVYDAEHGVGYSGLADVEDGPTVDIHVDCKTHSFDFSTEADGTFFNVPEDLGLQVTGTTIDHDYVYGPNSKLPIEYSWTLTRAE